MLDDQHWDYWHLEHVKTTPAPASDPTSVASGGRPRRRRSRDVQRRPCRIHAGLERTWTLGLGSRGGDGPARGRNRDGERLGWRLRSHPAPSTATAGLGSERGGVSDADAPVLCWRGATDTHQVPGGSGPAGGGPTHGLGAR